MCMHKKYKVMHYVTVESDVMVSTHNGEFKEDVCTKNQTECNYTVYKCLEITGKL